MYSLFYRYAWSKFSSGYSIKSEPEILIVEFAAGSSTAPNRNPVKLNSTHFVTQETSARSSHDVAWHENIRRRIQELNEEMIWRVVIKEIIFDLLIDAAHRLNTERARVVPGDVGELVNDNTTSRNAASCDRDAEGNDSPNLGANAAECSHDGSPDNVDRK